MKIRIFANTRKEKVKKNLPILEKRLKGLKADVTGGVFEAAFVLGGDGFLLKVLSEIYRKKVSVYFFPLGENTAIKGFKLTDVKKIITGEIPKTEYFPPFLMTESPAFNEIVIKTGQVARTIKYEVCLAGKKIASEGDGVIISTPLGSTAYNFAAGGPAVPLEQDAVIITPLLSFTGFSRSIVVPPAQRIKIKILHRQGDVWEIHDGRQSIAAKKNTEIRTGTSLCRIIFPRK
ncbi:MAG: hypothetical protein ABIJ15_05330 [bacterium]